MCLSTLAPADHEHRHAVTRPEVARTCMRTRSTETDTCVHEVVRAVVHEVVRAVVHEVVRAVVHEVVRAVGHEATAMAPHHTTPHHTTPHHTSPS